MIVATVAMNTLALTSTYDIRNYSTMSNITFIVKPKMFCICTDQIWT